MLSCIIQNRLKLWIIVSLVASCSFFFSHQRNSLIFNTGSQMFLLNHNIQWLFFFFFTLASSGVDKTERNFLSHFKMSWFHRFHKSWSSQFTLLLWPSKQNSCLLCVSLMWYKLRSSYGCPSPEVKILEDGTAESGFGSGLISESWKFSAVDFRVCVFLSQECFVMAQFSLELCKFVLCCLRFY